MSEVKRVLVSDKLAEAGLSVFREAEGVEVDYRPGLSPDELKAIIGGYHGLAIRSGTQVTAEVLSAAERLQVVGRAGIGVDNVDLDAAGRRGVVVMNTPGGNTVTTAEHTVALMMAVTRNVPQASAALKAGRWEKSRWQGRELFNKTLGVIGLGAIGRVVADRARGLRMKVVAYDPFLSHEAARKLEVEPVDLETLFHRADYVTVHVPLTGETRGLIDAQALSQMKDGVFVINCARGGVVDEADLAAALASGKVGGAAFDVFEQEPPPSDHPLLAQPRFICTPHLGASTEEAQVNVAVAVAEQMVAYLTRGVVENAVNLPSVGPEAMAALGPFLALAERLGSMAGQLGPDNPTVFRVTTSGEVDAHPTRAVALAALKGLLRHQLEAPVNEVNAAHLARDRGLALVQESEVQPRDYTSLLTVTVEGPEGRFSVCGTLFGRKELRVVRLDDFELEAIPEGELLVIHNQDRPGVIGRLGTLLGDAGINISRMHLSLDREKGEALALVNVDRRPAPDVLEALREAPHVLSAEAIAL